MAHRAQQQQHHHHHHGHGHGCVVGEEYRAEQLVELTVSRNAGSLSGEGFTVTDASDRVVFKMDGHFLSVRDKCVLKDGGGRSILCARKKMRTAHDRWEAWRGEDFDDASKLLFSVRKASMVEGLKTHEVVFVGGKEEEAADGGVPDFEIKGNFLEREVKIYQGDNVIAEVKRKFTLGNVMLDKHTFVTSVCPGIDQAFVVALIIIMDRIED